MKKLLCVLLLVSSGAFSTDKLSPLPDGRGNNNLSASGPEVIDKGSPFALGKGNDTYTYLRCYYRIEPANTSPRADYLWARNIDSAAYYRLQGSWWSSLAVSWKNMFYSDQSLTALNQVCENTLSRAGIRQPLVMIAAANNKLSFNYTIWNNDSPGQGEGINKIIAFGDSLSDTNNVFNASLWRFPNPKSWFLGRFSNGPTWIEYLAKQNHLPVYNWAVGGAASNQQKLVIPGLLDQVDSWLIYMKQARNYRPENSLFTVWIGANDLVTYNQGVDGLIANQTKALNRLVSAGAKKVLVLNLPDITRAPEFAYRKDGEKIKRQIDDYNTRIKQVVEGINRNYSEPPVIIFDLAELFTDMLDNPARYQVSETKMACLDIQAPSSLNYINAIPVRAACSNADTYVFWDLLHPTTHTHRLLAEHIAHYLKQQRVLP
ncbi:SGNH/GDSL hydrolase family protein [Serratia sp. OS31]|uniref:SGNH/GDSL hydrolase family protein n=1 Tax=Serratia sp. OS31 TaxID=2760844 RepID=UPI00160125D4|nr:SGNH/GDSL hydrolase family protein [Serratia sp. OS31]MBB1581855.1 SGNH/GDSL hydrolase family protein [Serratia sp. OS31]